ncbi:hypothetical protein DFQ26_002321 [Actinomortierella ambigua]|nr:hypothetical protein DFQ26_002321 [Actinomortierella ambigua]
MSSTPATDKDDPVYSPLGRLQPSLQSTASPLLLPLKSSPDDDHHHNTDSSSEPTTPPTSGWDDFFSFSTPTPKPPPRLAPMVSPSASSPPTRSRVALRDPPTPLIIPESVSDTLPGTPTATLAAAPTTTTITTNTYDSPPSRVQDDHHPLPRRPPRLGVVTHTGGGGGLAAHLSHHRTQSYSQFHSNALGNDLFARSPDANGLISSYSPSISSSRYSTSDTSPPFMTRAFGSTAASGIPTTPFDLAHLVDSPSAAVGSGTGGGGGGGGDGSHPTTTSTSTSSCATTTTTLSIATARPYSLTSTASPAATRSASPSLTPSNSQSNLCSNLPSPLPRPNLASSLRDGSLDSKQKLFSSWIASHPPIKPILESSSPPLSPIAGGGRSIGGGGGATPNYPNERSSSFAAAVAAAVTADTLAYDPMAVVPPPSMTTPTTSTSTSSSYSHPTSESAVRKNSVSSIVVPHGPSSPAGKIYPGLKNTVGPYKLIHSIGHGSFSEVKLAVDTRSGEQVAIKVMSRAVVQSSDRLGVSVRRESELLQSIHHINIIGFRGMVETSIQTCIVLDYAPGGELFEYVINNRVRASELDLQCIFSQIVDAVDYLHARNVVHRDLKLENVVLVPRATTPLRPIIKLTDFGLARVIEEDSPLLTTRCGSEDYAAPEIILGQPYDGREADIWSLGVILYALLVGFLPFNQNASIGRKTFLHMIATADFGFPGEKVLLHPPHHKEASAHAAIAAATATTTTTTGHSSLKNEILREAEAAFHPSIPTPAATTSSTTATATIATTKTTSSAASTSTATDHEKTTNGSHSSAESSATHIPTTSISSILTSESSPPTSPTPPPPAPPPPLRPSTSVAPAADIPRGRTVPAMKGVSAASDEAKRVVRQLLQIIGSRRPRARSLKYDPWVVTGRTTMWEQ